MSSAVAQPLSGPDFSSYGADDVEWLLTDVSGRVQHTTGVERERDIQSGKHYSESLPVEYEPSAEYEALVLEAIRDRALGVATLVTRLGERILADRPGPVLVSLARAGTPPGIMLRRWMRRQGVDAPHYTMSILLGRGLDEVAIDYLLARHDPASIVFVDGWTGKGSISGELRASIEQLGAKGRGINPGLAVLADPAATSTWSGTHRDELIPSAMLNSTVSGLVSRTVFSRDLIPEGSFHGAHFSGDLAARDLSRIVVDSVTENFAEVSEDRAGSPEVSRSPAGELNRIARVHGITARLMKPGICETTRVLLRRVPQSILLAEAGAPELRHLECLASERGVPVVIDPDLGFRAVGLIADQRS